MKLLHTLFPLVLLPALFTTEINLAQAGSTLSIDRAIWRDSKELLVFTGRGNPGSNVEIYLDGTTISLGKKVVNRRGYWRYKSTNPALIPCAIRAESGPYWAESSVARAPADCTTKYNVNNDNGGDDEVPVEEEPPVVVENTPPTINGAPSTQVAEGQSYSFTPSANDADNDNLTFSIVNSPSWSSFNSSTGLLSGTPGLDDTGTTSNIQISVSDGSASSSLSAFSITVTNTNQTPTITGTPPTSVAEGGNYRFAPSVSDPDGDNLSFFITNVPSWASFNSSTGLLSGTPGLDDAGTTSNIRITVSDGSASSSLSAFSITVTNTNQTPTITGTPPTSVAEGGNYLFTPSVSDPDGDNLSFSITNQPSWASFNSSTGLLSGTPGLDDAGTTNNISITVSDGDATASLNTFSITVINSNQTPVITGTPDNSVIAGDAYIFTPSASDPDDDDITFSVTNLPSWASFDNTSGVLSGTPGEEDTGLYQGIVISVSDSVASVSLAPLNLLVETAQPASTTGSVSLAWLPPSTRTDGTSLDMSEIAGYKVYMGTTQDNLELIMDYADSTTHNCVLDDIENGDYYFAVTTYDLDDNESAMSNIAMKSTQ